MGEVEIGGNRIGYWLYRKMFSIKWKIPFNLTFSVVIKGKTLHKLF